MTTTIKRVLPCVLDIQGDADDTYLVAAMRRLTKADTRDCLRIAAAKLATHPYPDAWRQPSAQVLWQLLNVYVWLRGDLEDCCLGDMEGLDPIELIGPDEAAPRWASSMDVEAEVLQAETALKAVHDVLTDLQSLNPNAFRETMERVTQSWWKKLDQQSACQVLDATGYDVENVKESCVFVGVRQMLETVAENAAELKSLQYEGLPTEADVALRDSVRFLALAQIVAECCVTLTAMIEVANQPSEACEPQLVHDNDRAVTTPLPGEGDGERQPSG